MERAAKNSMNTSDFIKLAHTKAQVINAVPGMM